MSQPDFLYELFEDFMDDPTNQDFSMDNGLICRWMTGQAKISPKISAYYSKPSNQEKLAHTIHQNLLPLMSDCNMAIQDIYTLFIQDGSISDAKKKNLHLPDWKESHQILHIKIQTDSTDCFPARSFVKLS